MRTTRSIAVGLVLILALVAAACGSETSGEYNLITEDTLKVCSEIPYPPFEDEVGGEYVGIDVEISQAIADKLGLDMEFIASGFDAITSGTVFTATCDMAASAITIKPEREEFIDFSDFYLEVDQSLLVKNDSGYSTLDDFIGRRLGVQSGTTGMDYALENAPDGVEIVDYSSGGELFFALEAGQIDGILQDKPVNELRAEADATVSIVQTYETNEQYGLAFQEDGKEALQDAVNDALADLKEDGTLDQIFAKWFGG